MWFKNKEAEKWKSIAELCFSKCAGYVQNSILDNLFEQFGETPNWKTHPSADRYAYLAGKNKTELLLEEEIINGK